MTRFIVGLYLMSMVLAVFFATMSTGGAGSFWEEWVSAQILFSGAVTAGLICIAIGLWATKDLK